MNEQDQIVERALAYPYRIPERSFLQLGDRFQELPAGELEIAGRKALLALGSNAAPSVLARKLTPDSGADSVPVVRGTLSDFDVVYSAHITAYGSIPAAIQVSPGTQVTIHVLHLTDAQLDLMSETEPNYRLALLDGVSCQLESGESLTSVATYVSRRGCLTANGSEVALESVAAGRRQFQTMSERGVLDYVRSLLSPDRSIEEFIEENVGNRSLARERSRALGETARPLSWPNLKFLDEPGPVGQTVAKRRSARRASRP